MNSAAHDRRGSGWLRMGVVVFLVICLSGCGGSRQGVSATPDLSRLKYDQNLELNLEGIIAGAADLQTPVSVAIDAEGQLIVAERAPARMIVIDKRGTVIRDIGGGRSGQFRLGNPRFVRSGFGLTINVADLNGELLIFDSRLNLINSFQPVYEASGFSGGSVSGLAISRFGDTYLADNNNDVIYHFDATGKYVKTIGDTDAGEGRLLRPEGLALTEDDELLVCDTGGQRLVLYDRDGQFLASIGSAELHGPVAVAVTPDNEAALVTDPGGLYLALFGLDGRLLRSWDPFDLVPGGGGAVADVVIDGEFLYLVDTQEARILKFRMVPGEK